MMRALLLFISFHAALSSNPFDRLAKLHALKEMKEESLTYPFMAPGATQLVSKSFTEGKRTLRIYAFSFAKGTDLVKVIHDQSNSRQGASIPIPLPEFEKKGFQIHYVAQPKYLECDVLVKNVWVQIGLSRGSETKVTVLDSRQKIADEFRTDAKNYKLLTNLLPEISKLANEAVRD